MLPSVTQGDALKRNSCSSKIGDDNNKFKEMVGVSKLILSIFPLIGYVQIQYTLPLEEGFSFSVRENQAPSKISVNTVKVNL